ncbi:MAG: recombination protein RecR [Clostridia bacterium]|nr:recombination protein RecR [Oscillospiraceae bacterium]MBR6747327.1 recombination protein RecR [Clostridia bacterium]
MNEYAIPVERLVEQFEKLPGIGHKSAQRLAFHVLHMSADEASDFAQAILEARQTIHQCPVCQNLTDGVRCAICADPLRDPTTICVVSDPRDVAAIERTREYRGMYHVLHGVLSPLNGVGPDELRIRELLTRVADEPVEEIIMATNPDTEGEATAMYIARLLAPFGIRITRLAYGIPVGGHLEFADEVTLLRALDGRRIMETNA